MPTTTNYGWTTPADTDLVKDGASAIRTLGTAIDTTVFNNASAAIAKTIVDAKGDLIVATAADTVARLASSGVNGEVLQVDTSTATGLKYGAIAAGANWTLLNSGGTALTGAATITISGISGKDKIMALVSEGSAGASSEIDFRLNADSGNNYSGFGSKTTGKSTWNSDIPNQYANAGISVANFARQSSDAGDVFSGGIYFSGCNSSGLKMWEVAGAGRSYFGQNGIVYIGQGVYTGSSTISSISILSSSGNFDGGTIYIYASA